MRKYLQLIVVLTIFWLAVLVRQLREPPGQPFPVVGTANNVNVQAVPSFTPSPQPTATLPATPVEATPTVAPALPTATEVAVVEVRPTATAPTVEATPTSTAAPDAGRPPATTTPSLFAGSVFEDGDFTGKPARISYGQMQVTIVMQNGWIEDVMIVAFPDRTPTSTRMSNDLLSGLIAEVIEKQDWDVDIVSGATQTVTAFKKAVVYALREAEQG